MKKYLISFILFGVLFLIDGYSSEVRAEAATNLNQSTYCSFGANQPRVVFTWSGPGSNPDAVWLDYGQVGGFIGGINVTGRQSFDGDTAAGANYQWRINAYWANDGSGQYWYPTSWRNFTSVTCGNSAELNIRYTNDGNSTTANVDFWVTDNGGNPVWGTSSSQQNIFVGANRTVFAGPRDLPTSNGPYTLHYTPKKSEGTAAGDFNCLDPHVESMSGGTADGVDYYNWDIHFTCNAPSVPTPPPPVLPTNLNYSFPSCSNSAYSGSLSWTNSGSGWWLDISTDPGFGGFSNKDVSGTTSTGAPGGFSGGLTLQPNTIYYWRIWNGSTHTNGPSWNVANCAVVPVGPTGLSATQSCVGGFPSVTFSWNQSSGADGYWVDVTTDNFVNFSNRQLLGAASTSTIWSASSPFGNGLAITQTPQNNVSYQWRVFAYNSAGGNHSSTAGLLTNNCAVANPPGVDIRANGSDGPIAVASGSSVTLQWTTINNPDSCTGSGAWSGAKSASGGSQVVTVSASSVFTITCAKSGYSNVSDSVTVNVQAGGAPTVDITANGSQGPITVLSGSSVTLQWTTTNNPTSCSASGAWSGGKAPGGGSQVVTVSVNSTFTITCSNTNGSASDSVVVNISAGSCDPNFVGTNQLVGCLWDGTNFNTADGQAPTGNLLSAPVPDSGTALDQDWGAGQASAAVGSDTFSARWKGNFTFKAGTYTFFAGADDGVRLRVDGATIIDSWIDSGYFERSATRTFSSQAVHNIEMDYYENNGAARASLRWVRTPPPPPTPPSNLGVSMSCSGVLPQVTFTWQDNSADEDNFVIDVSSGSAWSQWGVKTVGANQTSFVWTQSTPMDLGTPTTPLGATAYWFRMLSRNSGGDSPHVYYTTAAGDSITPPGDSFTTPDCSVDPDFDDLSSELQFYSDGTYSTPKTRFAPNETIFVQVKLKNSGGSPVTSPFWVGFYLEPGLSPACNQPPSVQKQILPPMGAGAVDIWQFTIAAPATQGTKVAYAFADYQCTLAETNENNNIRSKTYTVDVNSWFETVSGDVGAQGTISSDQAPPVSPIRKYNSTYLLAGLSVDSDVTTSAYKLNGYNKRLVPSGGTYNYLAERFRSRATGANVCSLPASIAGGNNFYQCTGDAVFSAGNGPGGNNVFFIDGNLNVNGNLTLAASDTATFIVKGNITVDPAVTRIDGIYVAGGTFTTTSTSGPQLAVNGSVYANHVVLGRTLSSSGCGVVPCDNAVNPAERIIFDPKYMVGLNSLLGTPSFFWREVAP